VSSADIGAVVPRKATTIRHGPGWLWLGIGVYALLLVNGNPLLNDPDTYWHIAVGRWILDHGTFPQVDIYSFTRDGEPWISTSWLAQVLFAKAYEWAGWSGSVALAAAASAVTVAQLALILGTRIPAKVALSVAIAALALTASHLLARPHVLALPVMVAWVHGLLQASERRVAPSFLLLPLMALWANLHGGFVLGLALVAPIAFDAWWNADNDKRGRLALRWIAFGALSTLAACVTPYGWNAILAARKILSLGELLQLIDEWKPVDFSHPGPLEISLLAAIAATLHWRVRLPLPRILLLLGLVHMALSHVRNVELVALLAPLVAAGPIASQFSLQPARPERMSLPLVPAAAFALVVGISSWAVASQARYSPPARQSQEAALHALTAHHAKRVLNDMAFAGFLILRDVPVFIDGRSELYGEAFGLAYYHALQLNDVDSFFNLLKTFDIDAVMLAPNTPAASLLNHMAGWQRAYWDADVVVHVRAAK
jgi:hypothetical protein